MISGGSSSTLTTSGMAHPLLCQQEWFYHVTHVSFRACSPSVSADEGQGHLCCSCDPVTSGSVLTLASGIDRWGRKCGQLSPARGITGEIGDGDSFPLLTT